MSQGKGIIDKLSHHSVEETVERLKGVRSEEHTSELQSRQYLVCRLLLEKKKYEKALRENSHTSETLRSVLCCSVRLAVQHYAAQAPAVPLPTCHVTRHAHASRPHQTLQS